MMFHRIILGTILVAATGSLVGMRTAPSVSVPDAKRAALLHRPVPRLHFDRRPAFEVIREIARAADLKIDVDWNALAAEGFPRDEAINFDADDLNVELVMQALTAPIREWHERAGYDVRGDTIVIAPDKKLHRALRIYDAGDLLNEVAKERCDPDEMGAAIAFCLEPSYWTCGEVRSLQERWYASDSSRLYISHTGVAQDRIEVFLEAVRAARADGSGPSIAKADARRQRARRIVIRFYDVRDLIDRIRFTVPRRPGNSDSLETLGGIDAVKALVAHMRSAETWDPLPTCGDPICCIAGRIAVEGSQESHVKLHAFLRNLRTGTQGPIPGLVMSRR